MRSATPLSFERSGPATALLVMGAALAAWEWAARHDIISSLFFPAPSVILRVFEADLRNGTLTAHTVATLGRLLAGVLIGGVPGLLIGLGMGWSPWLRSVADPLVALFHPLPKLALLPLIMMLVGIGEASRVVVIALAAFFPMLINAMAGVREIHAEAFETAAAYGARSRHVFVHVVLPGSLPLVLTGVRLSFNIGLLLAVAVELITAQQGLGRMIWLAWETMRTEDLYAALVVLAGIGVGFNAVLGAAGRWLTPWHAEVRR
jgi:NitT/TauT family transport system permease protein